ncbi:MAG: hypothetical protein WCD86_15985, partial [Ktedonobacteraceae bacterium]
MLRLVVSSSDYAKDEGAKVVSRWLQEYFKETEGIGYYRHPAVMTNTGAFPDFIVFTRTNNPLVIKIIRYSLQEIEIADENLWMVNNESLDPPPLELEDLVLKLESKFLEQRKLRNRLKPQAILALPFI